MDWFGGDWLAASDSPLEPLALWHAAAVLVAGLAGWLVDWCDCAGVDLENHDGSGVDLAGKILGLRVAMGDFLPLA
jgi:hypothetical protein